MRGHPPTIPDPVVTRPITYDLGEHSLEVAMAREGRWTVAVDGRPLGLTFDTQADAWQAGVREAHRADTLRGA